MTITEHAVLLANAHGRTVWLVTSRAGHCYVAMTPARIRPDTITIRPVLPNRYRP